MINMIAGGGAGLIACAIAIASVNLYANKKYEGKTWQGFRKLFRPFLGG